MVGKQISLGIMIVFSFAIAMYAVAFQARLVGSPTFHIRFDELPIFTGMHVIGGALVLTLGSLQFVRAIRLNKPALHRWMGRIYLSAVLFGGIAGLVMAPLSDGGLVAHYGFGMLAVLWLFSGWQAYAAIRKGNVQQHQEWMMRNFAMTFGAVTLRLHLGWLGASGIPFSESYPLVAWLAWVPNLILVEWYLALKAARSVTRQAAASA